jgi:hypothetical protein
MADDHINLAVSGDGTLYAALKAKHPSTSVPPVYMMVRRPNPSGPGGTWDNTLYPIDAITPGQSESGSGRRPLVVVNDDSGSVMKVFRAAIIAKPLPEPEHLLLVGLCQIAQSRILQ